MAWVEALLTKAFIEEGASDVEGFKALERSFSHQHRGQQIHSHFMRPLCQSTPRAPKYADDSDFSDPPAGETGPPRIVINDVTISKTEAPPSTPVKGSSTPVKGITPEGERSDRSKGQNSKDTPKGPKEKGEKPKKSALKGGKNAKEAPKEPQRPHYTRKAALDSRHLRSPGSPGRKDATMTARGNIFTFMPYLHFETDGRRQEMQQAIKRAETLKSEGFRPVALRKAATYDEMLIRAHLSSSSVSLHVRRTLDQFFYHNIDTQGRDQDQVVYRYQKRARALASHAAHSNTKDIEDDHPIDPKIFMVDQLWMWVLGKDLIVTSFPQRWQQPKNDPLNVLDGVIEDINSKTREPLRSVYELALLITGRCSGVFDRHRMGDEEYQFLDMFESSIGSATDRETMLFKEFNTASAQASAWLQHHRRPNRFSRHLEATHRNYEHTAKKGITPKDLDNREAYSSDDDEIQERFHYDDPTHGPLFVDKLLDIGAETDLLAETKDIRDELNMISKVLEDQRNVLPDLELSILEIFSSEHKSQLEIKKRCREQLKTIEMHVKDLERMDKQAERIYASITDLLDLKQKHANAFEARFARDQAAGTARQSQTIMVFTIVTIIFLPLSFIAAFFTINIREFPRLQDGTEALPLGYVSKYMFGIGFAISIPMIVIALSLDDIGDYAREAKRRLRQWKHRRRAGRLGKGPDVVSEKVDALELLRLEQVLSARKSVEDGTELDWGEGLLPVASRGTAGSGLGKMNGGAGAGVNGIETVRKVNTGFRIRTSRDVERGF
jgi:Mg2+ and Co2+ transporter CorA